MKDAFELLWSNVSHYDLESLWTDRHVDVWVRTIMSASLLSGLNQSSHVQVNTFVFESLKLKLSPKCNLGSLCECTWVKRSYKSIMPMKEAILRFTVFLFSGQTHFQWERYGHFYYSIKICIFKTLRSLDTTWNFAGSITRVSTHEHQHWEHCLCTQSLLKRSFLDSSR